jgi:hypothetical protein
LPPLPRVVVPNGGCGLLSFQPESSAAPPGIQLFLVGIN